MEAGKNFFYLALRPREGFLTRVRSAYTLAKVWKTLPARRALNLIKYNKKIQNKLNIGKYIFI
jgi:hypothetical protein